MLDAQIAECSLSGKSGRVLIVCGALSKGRDGVGDYTRQLAESLKKSGVEIVLAALAERGLEGDADGEEDSSELSIVRLRENGNWGSRLDQLRASFGLWEPDMVSIQLSPFGMAPRGILGNFGYHLRRLWPNAIGHVMMHELWCGMDTRQAPLKEQLLGWLQRRGLKRFLREFKPRMMHTSNPFYQEQLRGLGVKAELLPLPGAFPIAKPMLDAEFEEWLLAIGLTNVVADRQGWWLGCVFGSVYSLEVLKAIVSRVAAIAGTAGRRLAILFVGNAKRPQAEMLSLLEGCGVEVALAGFQSAEVVSQLIQRIDFGISTTPVDGVGKSISTASFLDHGAPVLVDPSRIAPCSNSPLPLLEPLLLLADDDLPARLRNGWPRGQASPRAPLVARQFMHDLGFGELKPIAKREALTHV